MTSAGAAADHPEGTKVLVLGVVFGVLAAVSSDSSSLGV